MALIPHEHVGGPWHPVQHVVVQGNVVCMGGSKCINVGDAVAVITPYTAHTSHNTLCTTSYTLQNDAPHVRLLARLYTIIHTVHYATLNTQYTLLTAHYKPL